MHLVCTDDADRYRATSAAEARVRFRDQVDVQEAEANDPDVIEVLLDPAQLDDKSSSPASGDAGSLGMPKSRWRRRRDSGSADHGGRGGGLRFVAWICRHWRDFRFRFARRFSRVFGRRRYDVATDPSDESAAAPALE